MKPRTLVALGMATTLLTGCAAGASEEWVTPQLTDVPAFTSASTLPFDAYHLAEPELEAMQQDHADLLSECAREFGTVVAFSGDYMRPTDTSRISWGGLLGTMDQDHASQYGYHPAPDGPWAPVGGFYLRDLSNVQPDPSASELAEATTLAELVLYGPSDDPNSGRDTEDLPVDADGNPIPEGGCYRIVETRIGAPLVSDVALKADLYNLALVHDRVVSAIGAWSECMALHGYEFTEVQGPSRSFILAELSPEELEVAQADVQCTAESRWADVFYAVLADYERQAEEREQSLLAAVLASETARQEALNGRP